MNLEQMYSDRIVELSADIARCRAEIDYMYGVTGTYPTGDRVQSSPYKDKIPDLVSRMETRLEYIDKLKRQVFDLTAAMDDYICTLDNAVERQVIAYKHVCGKTHSEIAELIDKSERQEYRIYKQAGRHLADKGETPERKKLVSLLQMDG